VVGRLAGGNMTVGPNKPWDIRRWRQRGLYPSFPSSKTCRRVPNGLAVSFYIGSIKTKSLVLVLTCLCGFLSENLATD
jgi:hypothetical protein